MRDNKIYLNKAIEEYLGEENQKLKENLHEMEFDGFNEEFLYEEKSKFERRYSSI